MHYLSTRDKSVRITAAQAIVQGLAWDGGLLTPEIFPRLADDALEMMKDMTYQQRAVAVMKLFLDDFTEEELTVFAEKAYGGQKFSDEKIAPVRHLDDNTYCMELWHGPTCAFKDMALQMLPQLLSASLQKTNEDKTACILVATSGDTGKAALEGFRDVEQTRIQVFYPRDGVSQIQQLQMNTQEGSNVDVCAVKGNFDDAQAGVKRIFSDEVIRAELEKRGIFLSSANSINWGRVLPQIVYYVSAYCDLLKTGAIQLGEKINFCVPTGNFGNILACYYAKKMGLPIGRMICASNANNVLTDFLHTGTYNRNRAFYNTISPSMDILVSSNLERMLFELSGENDQEVKNYMNQLAENGFYTVSEAIRTSFQNQFAAGFCNDISTLDMISKLWVTKHYLVDPHTAVAFDVLRQYRNQSNDDTPTVVVSTASPYKFCDSVLKALNVKEIQTGTDVIDQLAQYTGVEPPVSLSSLKNKQIRFCYSIQKEQMKSQVLGMLN